MSHDCMITQQLLSGQMTMFRIAEHGFGFSQKAIHLMTGMSLSAVGQYARGETAMSGPAIRKLCSVKEFPAELITLLFAGTGRTVTDTAPPEASHADYDDLAAGALAFAAEVQQARSENSPGGTAIVHSEEEVIRHRATRLASRAKAA